MDRSVPSAEVDVIPIGLSLRPIVRMTIGPDSFSPIVVPIVRLAAALGCD